MKTGNDLLEELYFLERRVPERHEAGHVTARMGQAFHDAGRDGIRDVEEDDGDVRDRAAGSPDRLVLERDDEVRPRPREFGGRDAGCGLVGQVAEVEQEVLAFFVAQRLEPVAQAARSEERRVGKECRARWAREDE